MSTANFHEHSFIRCLVPYNVMYDNKVHEPIWINKRAASEGMFDRGAAAAVGQHRSMRRRWRWRRRRVIGQCGEQEHICWPLCRHKTEGLWVNNYIHSISHIPHSPPLTSSNHQPPLTTRYGTHDKDSSSGHLHRCCCCTFQLYVLYGALINSH